jgi:hypothetical protein
MDTISVDVPQKLSGYADSFRQIVDVIVIIIIGDLLR